MLQYNRIWVASHSPATQQAASRTSAPAVPATALAVQRVLLLRLFRSSPPHRHAGCGSRRRCSRFAQHLGCVLAQKRRRQAGRGARVAELDQLPGDPHACRPWRAGGRRPCRWRRRGDRRGKSRHRPPAPRVHGTPAACKAASVSAMERCAMAVASSLRRASYWGGAPRLAAAPKHPARGHRRSRTRPGAPHRSRPPRRSSHHAGDRGGGTVRARIGPCRPAAARACPHSA